MAGYPCFQFSNLSIYSILWSIPTSLTPTCYTFKKPCTVKLAHQWTTTVPLASVNSSCIQASTEHRIINLSRVGIQTTSLGDQRYHSFHECIWMGPAWRQRTPTCYPALFVQIVKRESVPLIRQADKSDAYSKIRRFQQLNQGDVVAKAQRVIIAFMPDNLFDPDFLFCSNISDCSVVGSQPLKI